MATDRAKRALDLRELAGHTYREVGVILGVSATRAQQLCAGALRSRHQESGHKAETPGYGTCDECTALMNRVISPAARAVRAEWLLRNPDRADPDDLVRIRRAMV